MIYVAKIRDLELALCSLEAQTTLLDWLVVASEIFDRALIPFIKRKDINRQTLILDSAPCHLKSAAMDGAVIQLVQPLYHLSTMK